MKKIFFILLFFLIPSIVFAEKTTICSIGTTNGLLYSNNWNLNFYKHDNGEISWSYEYIVNELCSPGNCKNFSVRVDEQKGLDKLFSHKNFKNLSDKVTDGYNEDEIKNLINNGKCPEYVYVANKLSEKKIGFIFSSKSVSNSIETFKNEGYIINYTQEGGNMSEIAKENFENIVQVMKDNIQEFDDKNWDEILSTGCFKRDKFGGIDSDENLTINKYLNLREELLTADPNYDFSEGERIYNQYTQKKCGSEDVSLDLQVDPQSCQDLLGDPTNENTPAYYITFAFKVLRYVAIIIFIVITTMEFVGAVASQDNDIIKKATNKALIRALLCIAIFLLPTLIEFLLQFIHEARVSDCMHF